MKAKDMKLSHAEPACTCCAFAGCPCCQPAIKSGIIPPICAINVLCIGAYSGSAVARGDRA